MSVSMRKVRSFTAAVTYTDENAKEREEAFPVRAFDYSSATSLGFAYALLVLRLKDFELRMVGA
ncbi:MAG TPA: hypothetical protein VIE43_16520 [Thermoanaerobaculia bacterium]|jgi:hypothetical protein|nr:hypothetical protein [Thermoanaerobaculia bacterium]